MCSLSAALALSLVVAVTYLLARRRHIRYPPGPKAKPLIGNLLEVPPQEGWHKLTEFSKTYGDVVFFHGLGNKVLVLSSMQAITDLLEKRTAVYSDRPRFTVVGDLMGLGRSMALLPCSNEWRAQRRLAHHALSPRAVKQYHIIQEDLAAILCAQLVEDPDNFFSLVRLTASRLILSITYGLSVDKAEDEYIAHAEDTMHMISKATVPGAYLCDLFPILKHLPGWVPFQREAKVGRAMIEHLVTKPIEHVKEQMRTGMAPASLVRDLLTSDVGNGWGDHEHSVKWSTGSLYGAGGETTYSTVLTCIMAMALHPDKQRFAQAELDRAVGPDRLPVVADREQLPYVTALIKETMRWHPALPLGIAHYTTQEDEYKGYTIPKGTVVLPNVWAVAFEKQGPHDPHDFVPERFLGGDASTTDPTTWAFGFGRRICPGKHLAENSLFVLIASILAVFEIAPPQEDAADMKWSKGLVSYPELFNCRITPRSATRVSQVTWRAAQSVV